MEMHIQKRLEDHMATDERYFDMLSQNLEKLSSALAEFVEIRQEISAIKAEQEAMKTNIGWIVKIGGGAWGVALVIFTAMVFIVRESVTK